MIILGAKEIEKNMISVRSRSEGDLGSMKVSEFLEKIKKEIDEKI